MNIDDIQIHAGDFEGEYTQIRAIRAQVGAATAFSKAPTIEDVNLKLKEEASKIGADAVINVTYNRGIGLTSWKALTAEGVAIKIDSDEKDCPFCAEKVKKKAIKCKHCGADLPKDASNSINDVPKFKRKLNQKTIQKNLAPLVVCGKCGADNHSSNSFCENCGSKINKIESDPGPGI